MCFMSLSDTGEQNARIVFGSFDRRSVHATERSPPCDGAVTGSRRSGRDEIDARRSTSRLRTECN